MISFPDHEQLVFPKGLTSAPRRPRVPHSSPINLESTNCTYHVWQDWLEANLNFVAIEWIQIAE
jgi:hypothetical protein